MNVKHIFALAAGFIAFSVNAQNYFQQEVSYKINVKLNDVKHELSAYEDIEYKNNSTETLTFIWFHLWPNAYKNNGTALGKQLTNSGKTNFYFAKDEDRGYIDSLNFTSNGTALKWEFDKEHIDIAKVYLAKPLAPGESVTISTPFKVKIPIGVFSRMGHIKQQYQITQWYPKPAVFDHKGWHPMPYLDQGEFYSEYGSFEVKITLPANYVVASTGDLQEQTEIDWLNQKVADTKTNTKSGDEFPASATEYKTITYKQSKVHDFAWFADKRYLVTKSSVVLPQSKRTVNTYAYFTPGYQYLWKNAAKYVSDAVYYYSLWNGDYPYSHASAVDGALSAGGGMEYPNVTVIGAMDDTTSLETVIAHEVGHNWFYGILGSNERDNGWMDEGINSFNEMRYTYTKYPNLGLTLFGNSKASQIVMNMVGLGDKKSAYLSYMSYLFSARENSDQPIQTHSARFSGINYATIMYSKTAIAFDYLKAYLGDEVFDKCMHTYYEKWKFKHPYPEDLRKVFEEETGKDLSWFFGDIIQTKKRLDYKVRVKNKNTVVVVNRGGIAGPFSLTTISNENLYNTKWYEGFKGRKKIQLDLNDVKTVNIDTEGKMPEVQRKNNVSRTTGAFKGVEKLQVSLLGKIEDPMRSRMYYMPVLGWNYYNHAMLGVAFYNHTFPQRKFEYTLMPMFAIGTKSLNGEGSLAYNFQPVNGPFRQITVKGSVLSYHNEKDVQGSGLNQRFIKLTPELIIDIKKKNGASPISQQLRVRFLQIYEDRFIQEGGNHIEQDSRWLMDYSYLLSNKNPINKYTLKVNLQHNQFMSKIFAEFKYNIKYAQRKKAVIQIRAFAGGFLNSNLTQTPSIYFFRLSGYRGYEDYTYDQIYLGRSQTTGFFPAQFAETDGAFKMWSLGMWSSKWMAAVNIKSPLPGKFLEKWPIKLYASAATYGRMPSDGSKGLMFEVGPYLEIVPGVVEVYFPGYTSKAVRESSSILKNYKYYERIRFTLNLNTLKVFELLKKINF